jgi:DNA-3-methyladenine glycosylase
LAQSPPANINKLPRAFYAQPTLHVARRLIGMHLMRRTEHGVQIARIVETEAYQGPRDLAAHSSRGRTPRTEVMFGPPGHAYVYLIYGIWWCLNAVTRAAGTPHAVLIRALEPVAGIGEKTSGPGLLCKALEIDRRLNGVDLCGDTLWIEAPGVAKRPRITRAKRIGVDYAGSWAEKMWRFYDVESPFVSTLTASQRKKLRANNQ